MGRAPDISSSQLPRRSIFHVPLDVRIDWLSVLQAFLRLVSPLGPVAVMDLASAAIAVRLMAFATWRCLIDIVLVHNLSD